MKTSIILGLIVLSSLALASCTDKTTTNTPIATPVTTPPPAKTPDTMPAMADMDHGSMDMGTMTGEMMHMGADSEEEFLVNMLPHHQEAIDTATIIVAKTENAELKKIAEAIVSGQSEEVTTMKGWLTSWYPTSKIKTAYMPMMRDLSKLSGHDLDDTFMEDMIKHHEGAVHMAEEVLEVTQRPETVKLAKAIISAQNKEIAIFQKMLTDH